MNIKKNLIGATLSVVIASAGALSAQEISVGGNFLAELGVGFRMPIEAKIVKGAPFSADIVTESVQTLSDGNRIVQRSNTRFFRDSDGRVRREEERPSGSPAISITDPVTRRSFSLDSENHVAWQSPSVEGLKVSVAVEKATRDFTMTPPDVVKNLETLSVTHERLQEVQHTIEMQKIGPGRLESREVPQQLKIERLAPRNIEGVQADGVRRTTTIGAGAIGNDLPIEIVSEEWTSPDLKILVMTERRDPRIGTSTYRVLNINRAEPDRYLFEVPSDYTVKPTALFRYSGSGPKK